MELNDYLRILRRWWWLILSIGLLTAASAFAFTYMQTVVNTATTKLLIKARPDFGQTQTIKDLRRDFAEWLRTDLRAFAVIDALEEDMNPYEMLGNFKAEPSSDSSVITLQFKDENCDVASDVVRVWGDQLIQWRNDENVGLQKADRIEVESLYNAPSCGARPKLESSAINGAAGGVFGLLLGTLLTLLLEWYGSTRVRYQKDLEKLQLPVIGKIPQYKQTKQTETSSPKSTRRSRRRQRRN